MGFLQVVVIFPPNHTPPVNTFNVYLGLPNTQAEEGFSGCRLEVEQRAAIGAMEPDRLDINFLLMRV